MLAVTLAGCGTSSLATSTSSSTSRPTAAHTNTSSQGAVGQAHPQAVQPVAGDAGAPVTQPAGGQPTATATLSADRRPTSPATVTLSPAKGAPTDAQVRAAVAQFQAAVARYHLDRLNLAGALLGPSQLPPGQYNVSIASVYTDYGLPVACGGVLRVAELGVANKTLPCGTEVIFRYGSRAVRVPVIDRGPYIPGREWDLTGATAEALRFPGLGPIAWRIG
jgi:rare lipoprotein A (peptidoglycan hydrolase)